MSLCRFFLPFITLLMAVSLVRAAPTQHAYFKASNTGTADRFGVSLAISGNVMVVGAESEDSNATGVNGSQTNNSAGQSGAAYVFVHNGDNWVQQAYLKASNTEANDRFGYSVAVSGNTVVVGAHQESSSATGINGTQNNNNAIASGAAYVFVGNGTNYTQQAYLKASNTEQLDAFGVSVAISGDTVVIGARRESSNATGVNGNQSDNSALESGAAYVFVRTGTNWNQQAYLKASNTDRFDRFGTSVAISDDTIVVGAEGESTGGNESGAAYVFFRTGTNWTQQAFFKTSLNVLGYGRSVAVSGDTVVVGYYTGDLADIFVRQGTNWSRQASIKASNMSPGDAFGNSVAVWGDTVVVGARHEASNATGVNGNQGNNTALSAGAAYVFARSGTNWTQQTYLKASNTEANDQFGVSVAVSADTVVVAADGESSNATGVNGNQSDNSAGGSGAVYMFNGFGVGTKLVILPDGSGGYFIRCNGISGFTYQLQRAGNLSGSWTSNATMKPLSSSLLEFHDTNSPPGQAFYRVAHQ